jgi:hypothetical protein
MLSPECVCELRDLWLPHVSDGGLDRLIELLEKGSPLLVHGCFTRTMPMGCLATHIGWHHPETAHLQMDAGITWLYRVAGLNPATSHVIREWDCYASRNQKWEVYAEFRSDLLRIFREEKDRRTQTAPVAAESSCLVEA